VEEHKQRPPNILFILADDLGYGEPSPFPAVSKHGRIATPAIQQLSEEGMTFTSGYAGAPVCAPSRCTLMTGFHSGHCPIRGNKKVDGSDFPLPKNYTSIAKIVKSVGYNTGCVGKWGLGYNGTAGSPSNHSFDYYYGQLDQSLCHNYYPLEVWENQNKIDLPQNQDASRKRCMKEGNTCSFSNTLFYEKALEFLENQTQSTPWFLYLSWTVPHAGGWKGIDEVGAPVPSDGMYQNESWPDVEIDHAAQITYYQDKYIQNILDFLKKKGFEENTVVFFASDNGAHNEGNHDYKFFNSSGPLRGFKRSLYEGGIRSPSIVKWPGKVAKGSKSDYPWAFWDVLPTFADIVGAKLPNYTIDGHSIVPALFQQQEQNENYLYWEFCYKGWGHAVRKGEWKAVSFELNESFELYNITSDIHEDNNVAKKYPEIVQQLTTIAKEAHTDDPNWPTSCEGAESDPPLTLHSPTQYQHTHLMFHLKHPQHQKVYLHQCYCLLIILTAVVLCAFITFKYACFKPKPQTLDN